MVLASAITAELPAAHVMLSTPGHCELSTDGTCSAKSAS